MNLRRQILLASVVLIGGAALWVGLSPASSTLLSKLGVSSAVPGSESGGQAANGQNGAPRALQAPFVLTVAVAPGRINDRLSAIGTGEAIQSVVVTPQVAGTVAEVFVKSGDHVEKGAPLARLDNAEQLIARDQAQVALKSAREKADAYGNMTSSVARLDVFNARIAVEAAQLALDTAELNLKRRDIVAPISGIAGIVTLNPGDNVTTQSAILTLDDRSELLVDYWVPERFSHALKIGMPVEATSVARPADLFPGAIEAIDNRIDQTSRTLRVRARIPNAGDVLRAGMAFSVAMSFPGETYPAVDPLSVQWDSAGAYVWRVTKEMKAEKVPVRIVQRNPDRVLVEGALETGDAIVTEGLQRVRQGAAVRLPGSDAPRDKDNGGGDRPAVKS